MTSTSHRQQIIEQFSKQAGAYTAITAHSDALDKLIQMSHVQQEDTVLDVACGSGMVSCAFAEYAKQVTGIDCTEGMIAEAKKLQQQKNLPPVTWQTGDAEALPYANETFSIVVSRFGFHHFPEPEKVFAEMMRVCKKGGRIVVADVCLPEEKVAAYDEMEKLRDPSHAGVLTQAQFVRLFTQPGLMHLTYDHYRMAIELEQQLAASFPAEGDRGLLKQMIMNDIGIDRLGVEVKVQNGLIYLHYPVAVFVAECATLNA